jgi:hypothetical protein
VKKGLPATGVCMLIPPNGILLAKSAGGKTIQ